MRKKLLSNTYLRDVKEYIIKFDFSNEDYFCVSKNIIDTEPFILNSGIKLIDNGYYIVEILPKNEKYVIRVFLDNDKNVIEYYIDITNGCGIDENTKIPYYDDLYLDITITDDIIEVLDQNELDDAYNKNLIDNMTYNMAINTKNKLLIEIEKKNNKYLNINFKDLLNEI